MKRSSYFHLKDNFIDCLILLDGIKYVEIRQMDERPSISGIYILYTDGTDCFVYTLEVMHSIKELYQKLLDHLLTIDV
jgi:hypothetical protein